MIELRLRLKSQAKKWKAPKGALSSRIELGWLTFVVPAALTTMIALFTIGYQILRSASTNPVEALRTDHFYALHLSGI
ncbi:MAG: hypothetical protein ACRENG_20420 [bacterium]